MLRQAAPKIRKVLDIAVIRREAVLEISAGVNVHLHRQPMRQNHFHRRIEVAEVIGGNLIRLPAPKHRRRIDAQPHMIEPHRLNQPQVLIGNRRIKMLLRKSLRIAASLKPFTQINPMSQMTRAPLRHASRCSRCRHRRSTGGRNRSALRSPGKGNIPEANEKSSNRQQPDPTPSHAHLFPDAAGNFPASH